MSVLFKSWLLTGLFLCVLLVIVAVLDSWHGSGFLTAVLVLAAVIVSAMVGGTNLSSYWVAVTSYCQFVETVLRHIKSFVCPNLNLSPPGVVGLSLSDGWRSRANGQQIAGHNKACWYGRFLDLLHGFFEGFVAYRLFCQVATADQKRWGANLSFPQRFVESFHHHFGFDDHLCRELCIS